MNYELIFFQETLFSFLIFIMFLQKRSLVIEKGYCRASSHFTLTCNNNLNKLSASTSQEQNFLSSLISSNHAFCPFFYVGHLQTYQLFWTIQESLWYKPNQTRFYTNLLDTE